MRGCVPLNYNVSRTNGTIVATIHRVVSCYVVMVDANISQLYER